MTHAKTTAESKIRRLISENIEDGYERCVEILNDGGFVAPCGHKYRWKGVHVKAIISGKVFNPFIKNVSTLITEYQFDIVKKYPASIACFVREAISEKISRDNLVKGE